MHIVGVDTICSAMFSEVKKRKEMLQKLKTQLVILSKDIDDITLRYIDSLYRPERQELLVELKRKKDLKNALIDKTLKLLGQDAALYNRHTSHIELIGDSVKYDDNIKGVIIPSSEEELSDSLKNYFEDPFFEETPYIIRSLNDNTGIYMGRDSVSVHLRGASLTVKSDDSSFVDSRMPVKNMKRLTEEILDGYVDIDKMPDYLRSVIEQNDHNETIVYDDLTDRERSFDEYYANLDGKKLLLMPKHR